MLRNFAHNVKNTKWTSILSWIGLEKSHRYSVYLNWLLPSIKMVTLVRSMSLREPMMPPLAGPLMSLIQTFIVPPGQPVWGATMHRSGKWPRSAYFPEASVLTTVVLS